MNEIRHPNDYDRRRSAVAEPVSSLVIWDGIAGFLKRRRRTILATALAVLVLGLAALLFVPWNYKATAIVAINAQPAIAENSQNHVQLTPAERMQREIQGLQSRALAAQVIEKLKLDREPEFNPDLRGPGLIERALASVSITPNGEDSARGMRMPATVTPAPDSMCWSSICQGSMR